MRWLGDMKWKESHDWGSLNEIGNGSSAVNIWMEVYKQYCTEDRKGVDFSPNANLEWDL